MKDVIIGFAKGCNETDLSCTKIDKMIMSMENIKSHIAKPPNTVPLLCKNDRIKARISESMRKHKQHIHTEQDRQQTLKSKGPATDISLTALFGSKNLRGVVKSYL